jgi:hypothetical protein
MNRLRAAIAWAKDRSDEDARGVLLRLADALAQGPEQAEREASAMIAPPAPSGVATEMPPAPPPPPPLPPPPSDDEPLEFERISEAETPSGARTVWSVDEPELSNPPDEEPAGTTGGDLGLVTDRWREAEEQVAEPPRKPAEPPPWPEVPAIEPARASSPAAPPPLPAAPPKEGTLEFSPLVEASAPPPAEEPVAERTSAKRSVPFARVLVEERRRRSSFRIPLIVGGLLLVAGAGVAAFMLGLVPTGGGRPTATANPTPGSSTPEYAPPTAAPPVESAPGGTSTPAPVDTARTQQPPAPPPDPIRPVDTIATRADTAARDTALPPPTPIIPPVEVSVPTPAPIVPVDSAPSGPPTVRVPPGTSLRDLLIVVPALPVESVVVVPVAGRRGHRVVQRLPDGEPLMLASVPMTGSDTVGVSDARITVVGDTTVGSVRFWNFLVTARARADADTLAQMLRRLVRARPVR